MLKFSFLDRQLTNYHGFPLARYDKIFIFDQSNSVKTFSSDIHGAQKNKSLNEKWPWSIFFKVRMKLTFYDSINILNAIDTVNKQFQEIEHSNVNPLHSTKA